MRFRSSVINACLCVLCFAIRAEETPVIGTRPAAFFITDYLPPAIYDGDGLSACFRIENASSHVSNFEVHATALDAEGAEVKALVEKPSVESGAFAPVKFEFDARRVARIKFELKNAGDAAVLASASLVLLSDDDPWPKTKIAAGRIALADGSVVVPVVQKKRAVEERAFAPLTWILGSPNQSGPSAGKCVAYAPGSWGLARAPKNDESIRALGPWPLDGSIPILNAMNRILSDLSVSPPGEIKRVAIMLPPEDLDLATDPRTYRVVLDALQARLAKLGIARVILLSPFKYGCNDAHRKALWREVHESAAVNAAKVVDPLDWMGEAQWRADPATPRIYAQRPNAAGRKMIEQALADLIR